MFDLGEVRVSQLAGDALAAAGQPPDEFVQRHASGDWGDVAEETRLRNQEALQSGGPVESVYHTRTGDKILVSTQADRRVTVVMFPNER